MHSFSAVGAHAVVTSQMPPPIADAVAVLRGEHRGVGWEPVRRAEPRAHGAPEVNVRRHVEPRRRAPLLLENRQAVGTDEVLTMLLVLGEHAQREILTNLGIECLRVLVRRDDLQQLPRLRDAELLHTTREVGLNAI